MGLSKNARKLLKDRYCVGNEKPLDVFKRVAGALSLGDDRFEKDLYKAMIGGYFMPASPTLRNAGFKKKLLHPCCVLPISDNVESIFETIKNTAICFHFGAGVGISFSSLRPKGDVLSSGGMTSGVLSFLEIFDKVTESVKEGGFRKGGVLGVLDVNHPEILDFISYKLKGRLNNFNISVMMTDEFMKKVKDNKKINLINPRDKSVWSNIGAGDLFELIAFAAYSSGDPGLLFYDRINKDNPLYPKKPITACNLCSELPLFENLMCNLGSINLSKFVKGNKFDSNKFGRYVKLGTRTLLNINGCSWYPLPEITKNMKEFDPVGLGLAGMADLLIKLGIYYDSEEHLKLIDEIKKPYVEITNKIAKKSFYKRSLPPTGSVSILLDASPATEPIFETIFERHLTIGILEETRDLYKSKYVRTAHQVSPDWRLKIQAKWQNEVIDSGISSTINLPNNATVEQIKDIYYKAWELGLKGITIFRDGSKDGKQVLKVSNRKKCDESSKTCPL